MFVSSAEKKDNGIANLPLSSLLTLLLNGFSVLPKPFPVLVLG